MLALNFFLIIIYLFLILVGLAVVGQPAPGGEG